MRPGLVDQEDLAVVGQQHDRKRRVEVRQPKRSWLSRRVSSAALRAVMSWTTPIMRSGLPAASYTSRPLGHNPVQAAVPMDRTHLHLGVAPP